MPDLPFWEWFNPSTWATIASADGVLQPPANTAPCLLKPAADFGLELQAALNKAYYGPHLAGLQAGHLPVAFEVEHRSTPGQGSLLQIVSGQTLLGEVTTCIHKSSIANANFPGSLESHSAKDQLPKLPDDMHTDQRVKAMDALDKKSNANVSEAQGGKSAKLQHDEQTHRRNSEGKERGGTPNVIQYRVAGCIQVLY
jgi:hypothetical protein